MVRLFLVSKVGRGGTSPFLKPELAQALRVEPYSSPSFLLIKSGIFQLVELFLNIIELGYCEPGTRPRQIGFFCHAVNKSARKGIIKTHSQPLSEGHPSCYETIFQSVWVIVFFCASQASQPLQKELLYQLHCFRFYRADLRWRRYLWN